ncbi:S1C family serine protease [Baekduia sp. Peel2402]|uniref:S1C family serine protease n=1 Tax=Baekduia sp. Peel2402 TaxID=3458296 RepID=UPI00403EB570
MNVKPAAAIFLSVAALAGGAGGAVVASTKDAQGGTTTATTTTASGGSTAVASATTSSDSKTVGEVYKTASQGVVDLIVTTSEGQAEGSGFVVDAKGDIVTNAHVVDGASAVSVTFSDGTKAKASVVGTDTATDLAVVRVSGVSASKLHPLTLGASDDVEVGDGVLAIGSPFGLSETLTTGIVSALDRTITSPSDKTIGGAIQTDASINHGNSGGPLLNQDGEVIGVNAQIESDSGGNDGVGFAIPSDTVRTVAAALIAGETVQHPQLGVQIQDGTSGGVKLAAVTAGGAAAEAGLKAGDTITAIDGQAVSDADALASLIASHQPGDELKVTYTRDGASQTATAKLGTAKS